MVDNSIVISDLGIVPFFYKNCTAVGVESILLKCTHCIKKLKEKQNLYSPMVEYGFEPRGKSVEALLFYAVELKGITMRNYEQLSKNLNELFHSSQVQCICKAGKKREVRRMNKNNNNQCTQGKLGEKLVIYPRFVALFCGNSICHSFAPTFCLYSTNVTRTKQKEFKQNVGAKEWQVLFPQKSERVFVTISVSGFSQFARVSLLVFGFHSSLFFFSAGH